MFVVKGKTTAMSFIKVVNIKKYYDEYVILNISKSYPPPPVFSMISGNDPCHKTRHKPAK
jgi:hypothetical protein